MVGEASSNTMAATMGETRYLKVLLYNLIASQISTPWLFAESITLSSKLSAVASTVLPTALQRTSTKLPEPASSVLPWRSWELPWKPLQFE